MSAIRTARPKLPWKASPATGLPIGLRFGLFKVPSDYTVVIDDQAVGQIGKEQVTVFEVEPGKHRLHMRFIGRRKSEALRVCLKTDEERQFICGASGMGCPPSGQDRPRMSPRSRGRWSASHQGQGLFAEVGWSE